MAFVRDDEPLPDSVTRLPVCPVRSSPSSAVAVVRPSTLRFPSPVVGSPLLRVRSTSAVPFFRVAPPVRNTTESSPAPAVWSHTPSVSVSPPCPWPPPSGSCQRHLSISIPDAKSGYRYLAPAEGDVPRCRPAVRAAWCLSFRAADRLSVVLHHRLQHLQPGRDAQAVTRMRDVPQHAEHRQRHPDRHRTRGGWRRVFRLSLAMGGSFLP